MHAIACILSMLARERNTTFASYSLKAVKTQWRRFTRFGAVCADLSEIQRDLMDMNMRYDGVEERLANREKELQDMLDNVKVYLQVRDHTN